MIAFLRLITLIYMIMAACTGGVSATDSITPRFHPDQVALPGIQGGPDLDLLSVIYNPITDDVYAFISSADPALLLRWTVDGGVDTLGYLAIAEEDQGRIFNAQVLEDGKRIWIWDDEIGNVYEFDIAAGTTTMISETLLRYFMYGNAAIVAPDETIFSIGGYGYWEFKNLLLRFNPSSRRDWFHLAPEGAVPPKSQGGQLWYAEDTGELLYLAQSMGVDQHPDLSAPWQLHAFSIERNAWRKVRDIRTKWQIPHIRYGQRFHSTDGRLYHLYDRYFLDRSTLEILRTQHPELMRLDRDMLFFSTRLGRWIVAGIDVSVGPGHMQVITLDPAELHFESITRTSFLDLYPKFGWYALFGVLLCGSLIIVTVLTRKRSSADGNPDPVQPLLIAQRVADNVVLMKDGEKLMLSDPTLKKLWMLIHRLVKDSRYEIPLNVLDQHVFPNTDSLSQISRQRQKLFNILHEQVGHPVIVIDKDLIDGRFRNVRFNVDGIEFTELEGPSTPTDRPA